MENSWLQCYGSTNHHYGYIPLIGWPIVNKVVIDLGFFLLKYPMGLRQAVIFFNLTAPIRLGTAIDDFIVLAHGSV